MREDDLSLLIAYIVIIGAALATVISWTAHKSILWAALHGLLSWLYVVYYAINA